MNTAAPSMMNGYRTNSAYLNTYYPAFYGSYGGYGQYGQYGQNFGQNLPSTQNPIAGNTNFEGLTQEDMNNLADYYAKSNLLQEGFAGAALGGLSWAAYEHAQSIIHPFNAYKGIKEASQLFKNVPTEFYKQNSHLMQEAYIAVQQAGRDTQTKWFYSKWLRKPIKDPETVKNLITEMQNAINAKDVKKIAELTEKLQGARGFDGRLIPGKELTAAERIAKKTQNGELAKKTASLLEFNKCNWKSLIKGTFKNDFIGFMGFELAFSIGKILTAFNKDTDTGIKQTGQSIGKAGMGVAGWCVGRGIGTLLGAKAGALIAAKAGAAVGSVVPGLGTAVGAIVGFTIGSIGMWAGHKLGEYLFGQDVADKIEARNLTKTQEGQVQLLQFAAEKMQNGEHVDPKAQLAVQKFINAYA